MKRFSGFGIAVAVSVSCVAVPTAGAELATPLAIPSNDLVENALGLTTASNSSAIADAQDATTSASDPPHSCAIDAEEGITPRVGSHTLWFTYRPSFDGTLDVDTLQSSGSFTDTILTVYSGSPESFTEVACNDDTAAPGGSLLSELDDVAVEGGTQYYFYVSRSSPTPTTSPGTATLVMEYTPDPAVVVAPTSLTVSESGREDSFQVQLTTAPTLDVVISVVTSGDCIPDTDQLVFDSENFSTPQTVDVSAPLDDDFDEGDETCTIVTQANTSDPVYDGLPVEDVTVTVEDAILTDITITSPSNGATFTKGARVVADFACTDNRNGDGIFDCSGTVADGTPIDTSTAGTKTFTVTLIDAAERSTTLTHTYTVTAPPARPDARARKGTSGAWIGDGVYRTPTGQTVRGAARTGKSVTFQVSVQNDASFADRFTVKASGSANGYTVRYQNAAGDDITSAVKAGTYRTSSLAPGKATTITVKVTVNPQAKKGSALTRKVTVSSVAQPARTDAVTLVASRRN